MLGSSVDGSYIYFVSAGVLENNGTSVAGAISGKPNLYLRHEGKTSLVGGPVGRRLPDWARCRTRGMTAGSRRTGAGSRSCPNRQLTGYDNQTPRAASPTRRLYLYDAATNRTSCASCDPTGARPAGVRTVIRRKLPLVRGNRVWENSLVARRRLCRAGRRTSRPTHPTSRATSPNNGRLFFNAHAPLVPNDVNNQWDVYQYEPEGLGAQAGNRARRPPAATSSSPPAPSRPKRKARTAPAKKPRAASA